MLIPIPHVLMVYKISVLINQSGTDTVFIFTDLPSPFPKEVSNNNLTLKFDVQKGKAIEYVKNNFPLATIEVIDASTGKIHMEE